MTHHDKERPNIVFVLTDDQGYWALGAAGNAEIETPTLDRLAEEGMHFTNFFCASPVCSPARASILTGRIPSQHGVHDWIRAGNTGTDAVQYLEGQTSYTQILAENGYICGLVGKWHLGDSIVPQHGFSHWFAHKQGGGPYYGAELSRNGGPFKSYPEYLTDVITDEAIDFLQQQEDGTPFYLGIHYTAPHSPWDKEQHPEELRNLYKDCPFLSCPNEPMHPWQINSAPWGTSDRRHEFLSGYYAAVTSVDRNLQRVLNSLKEQGLDENTMIVFTSDNGMNMGHHGIYGKGNGTFPQNMYDTSVKVPMIIWQPGEIAGGQRPDSLLSQYDIFPTLLEYLGLSHPCPNLLPGRSFAPLLQGRPWDPSDAVIVFDEYGPVRMVRTKQWKYVHRYPYGPHELYDLVSDPDETSNRIDDRELQSTREGLKATLDSWFLQYADPSIDGTREAVTGRGQLGLAGKHSDGRQTYAQDFELLKGKDQ